MKFRSLGPLCILLVTFAHLTANTANAAASLELYGNFHAMGVVVTLLASDDPDLDASATLEVRENGGNYRSGYPLTRVSVGRFAGSLFWLDPNTEYDVRVTFSDPDTDPIDLEVVTGTASTRAEITQPSALATYIVSASGNGTACSLATPCALSEGIGQARAGDLVSLRGGVYSEGEISLPYSGAAGAPIMIRSYPGETAILDGADPASFSWSSIGGGVYQTAINVADPHLVTADGDRLYPYASLFDLQNLIWSLPGFYVNGTTLDVRLAGDVDPSAASMQVSRYGHAFFVGRNFIYFSDLMFRHYGQGAYAKAIYLDGGSDNLIQNCTFAINDLGIGIKRASHRNTIQGNEFYDTNFLWTWEAVKADGLLETGGLVFYSPTTGRGNVIRNNTFHDYFDGFGICPEDNGTETNETDVYENDVYNTGDDGLSADGACSNVRIWDNQFRNVLVGISLAPVYEGPLYAIGNLIYRTGAGVSNAGYKGYPFKFNSGFGRSGSMYLFHNTADGVLASTNGFWVKSPGSWDAIVSRNNIWAGTDHAVRNDNALQSIDLDYDNVYTPLPDHFALWDGSHLSTLENFQAATGQEANGYALAPEFMDADVGDYSLNPASNMVDKGLAIPGINDGYEGAAPDLGAFEAVPEPGARGSLLWGILCLAGLVHKGSRARSESRAANTIHARSSTAGATLGRPTPSR